MSSSMLASSDAIWGGADDVVHSSFGLLNPGDGDIEESDDDNDTDDD